MSNFRTATYPEGGVTGNAPVLATKMPLTELITSTVNALQSTNFAKVIYRALVALYNPVFLPTAPRAIPHAAAGTVRYVDPTGANGTGTFASPFNNMAAAMAVAVRGDLVLLKEGTTAFITAAMLPPATAGTTPFVFGTYNPGTGARTINKVGAATINCSALAIDAITGNNTDWVCVENLAFTNNGAGNWLVNFSGTAANCQQINCRFVGGGYHGTFQTSGDNNIFDGCESLNCTNSGLVLYLNASGLTSKIQYCYARGGVDNIIVFELGGVRRTFNGEVSNNVVEDAVDPSDYRGGIQIATSGGAMKVYKNIVRRCTRGINIGGTDISWSNFAGTIIENNECYNNEFGLSIGNMSGPVKAWFNILDGSGSKNGKDPVTVNKYGRGLEAYGLTAPVGVRRLYFSHNICTNTVQHSGIAFPGTEGCGIGADNNTTESEFFNNYVAFNEGNGIQLNVGANNKVYSNLCIDNFLVSRQKMPELVNVTAEAKSDILHIQNPGVEIFNNTCLSFKRFYQNIGIAESIASPSSGAYYANNLMINFNQAGLLCNPANTRELNNRVVGQVFGLTNALVPLTPSAASGFAGDADYEIVSNFVFPTKGNALDRAGISISVASRTFNNQSIGFNAPVGCTGPIDF